MHTGFENLPPNFGKVLTDFFHFSFLCAFNNPLSFGIYSICCIFVCFSPFFLIQILELFLILAVLVYEHFLTCHEHIFVYIFMNIILNV